MKTVKFIGLIILAVVWLWLCRLIIGSSDLNLIKIFWIAASGIIIFVPLWKKYIAPEIKKK